MNRRDFITGVLAVPSMYRTTRLLTGIRLDDTVTVQSMIDATPKGGICLVPAGTYMLRRTLNLNDITLQGAPDYKTVLRYADLGDPLELFNGNNVIVTGFHIENLRNQGART